MWKAENTAAEVRHAVVSGGRTRCAQLDGRAGILQALCQRYARAGHPTCYLTHAHNGPCLLLHLLSELYPRTGGWTGLLGTYVKVALSTKASRYATAPARPDHRLRATNVVFLSRHIRVDTSRWYHKLWLTLEMSHRRPLAKAGLLCPTMRI